MDDIAPALEAMVPALRRYARALVRDRDGADDLVQDCLERALARSALRRRDGDLRAWLFAILHNLFIDGVRRRRREGFPVEIDDAFDLPAVSTGVESRLALGDVLGALDRLPTDYRAVLLLVGVEDLSYEEAAAVLGVPIGTVMSRLSRARARLRRSLEAPSLAPPSSPPNLRRVK